MPGKWFIRCHGSSRANRSWTIHTSILEMEARRSGCVHYHGLLHVLGINLGYAVLPIDIGLVIILGDNLEFQGRSHLPHHLISAIYQAHAHRRLPLTPISLATGGIATPGLLCRRSSSTATIVIIHL